MLKKVTGICALILIICLIAGAIFVPVAIRDLLQGGDRIAGKFIKSSEIYSCEGKDVTLLQLHLNDLPVYIEQSGDSHIYLRIEGLFADGYAVSESRQEAGEQTALSLSLDNDAHFFDTSSVYLLRSGILDTSAAWAILRIPSWVSVETGNSPWNIRCVDDVQFQNKEYYTERLWNRDEDWERRESLSLYRNRFQTINSLYRADLQKALLQLEAGELSPEDYESRLDETTKTHQERMEQKIYPAAACEPFDSDLLAALLGNYFELTKSAARQQGLLEEEEPFSERYSELQQRCSDLRSAAEDALDEFLDYYEAYLADLSERAVLPQQEDAESPKTPQPAESAGEGREETASSTIEPVGGPAAPDAHEEPETAPLREDVLSAPSVYAEG